MFRLGMTAHHGWNEFSQAKQGETVFVTAASGMHVLRVPTRLAGRSDRLFRSSRGVRTLCSVILFDITTLTLLRRTVVQLAKAAGLKVMDFAKRLQDYGFHPPTCSWPISTCMLIEPTESETLEEIDRSVESLRL